VLRCIPQGMNSLTQAGRMLTLVDSSTAVEDAVNVLHGLLTSIPTFWGGGELEQVIKLCIEHSSSAPAASMTNLTKAMAKKAPPKVLLPTISTVWPMVSLQSVRCLS
jgi:hypothetical protein